MTLSWSERRYRRFGYLKNALGQQIIQTMVKTKNGKKYVRLMSDPQPLFYYGNYQRESCQT
jgi:hypothetical protein